MAVLTTYPFYEGNAFRVMTSDLGDTWLMEGIVIGNGHNSLLMQLSNDAPGSPVDMEIFRPTVEQLDNWMKNSDDPIAPLYQDGDGKVIKAIVRKATRQVDQNIAWACYARDNYTCCYCGRSGVPLTYDHYLAQAFGGPTTLENGRSSCRRCNKAKGHMTIDEWKAYALSKGLNDGSTITS